MEPHSVDLAHELAPPRHEGVFGPLLWIDRERGLVWQEAFAEQGTGTRALLVWVGTLVAAVSEGVPESEVAKVSECLRSFLRRSELPVVFQGEWLPNKTGIELCIDATPAVPRRELARAAAYALVQSAWLDRERVRVELDGESFDFDVRSSPDEEGRLLTVIK
ncbi:MAG TPA: hypothetical protein VM686_32750 [Polyangiaceae bacterium]|nr:hypothetical protein [Polyangiaceae bacterium]